MWSFPTKSVLTGSYSPAIEILYPIATLSSLAAPSSYAGERVCRGVKHEKAPWVCLLGGYPSGSHRGCRLGCSKQRVRDLQARAQARETCAGQLKATGNEELLTYAQPAKQYLAVEPYSIRNGLGVRSPQAENSQPSLGASSWTCLAAVPQGSMRRDHPH